MQDTPMQITSEQQLLIMLLIETSELTNDELEYAWELHKDIQQNRSSTMKLTPYQKWLKLSDTYVPSLSHYQDIAINKQLKKAYMAGVKQGRIEATELAIKSIKLRQMLEITARVLP